MITIQNAWFKQSTYSESDTSFSSNSLGLESFWGLFLITGVASFLALIIFAAMFLYEHRQVLMNSDAEPSLWRRIVAIFRTFDKKDLSSHTYRKSEAGERSIIDMSSPNTNGPPSPSGYSVRTDSSFVFREHGMPSPDPNGTQPTNQDTIVSAVELTFQSPELREHHNS